MVPFTPIFGSTTPAHERRRHTRAPSSMAPVLRAADGPLSMNIMYKLLWQVRDGEHSRQCNSNDRLRLTSSANLNSSGPILCQAQMFWEDNTYNFSCQYDADSKAFVEFMGEVSPTTGMTNPFMFKLEVVRDHIDENGGKVFHIKAFTEYRLGHIGCRVSQHRLWAKKVDENLEVGTSDWKGVKFSRSEMLDLGFVPTKELTKWHSAGPVKSEDEVDSAIALASGSKV